MSKMSIYGDTNYHTTKSYSDAGDELIKKKMNEFTTLVRDKMYVPNLKRTIHDLKQRKPIITVWAEESGPLRNGAHEFAFGNGSSGSAHENCGYTMLCSGRVLRMGLCSVTRDGFATEEVKIGISINGTSNVNATLTKHNAQRSAYTIFQTPIELASGSVLNFVSLTTYSSASISIVDVLIELDI